MPVHNTAPARLMHGIVNQKNPLNPSAGIERTRKKKTEATKTSKEKKPKLTKAEKKKRKREKNGK